jgi:hypothetical protein
VEDRPSRLKARIFPFDVVDVSELLKELERGRFIIRYVNGEHACLQIRTFEKHQKPHPKEPVSDLPNLSDEGSRVTSRDKTRRAVKRNGESGGLLSLGSGLLSLDSGSGGLGSSEALARSEPPPPPPEPPGRTALRFPTVGPIASWALSDPQVATWAELFPNLDVLAECQQALAWVLANPTKTKTARGMPGFLVRWLGRSADRSRAGPSAGLLTRGERAAQVTQAGVAAFVAELTHEHAGAIEITNGAGRNSGVDRSLGLVVRREPA